MALLTPLKSIEPALHMFFDWPSSPKVNYNLGNQFQLVSYQVVTNPQPSGHTLSIILYWQLLADAKYEEYTILIEILNSQGSSIIQTKHPAKQLFRWRHKGDVISSERSLDINPELGSGPFTLRISLFDRSNKPVSIYTPDEKLLGTQAILGDFYVSPQ